MLQAGQPLPGDADLVLIQVQNRLSVTLLFYSQGWDID